MRTLYRRAGEALAALVMAAGVLMHYTSTGVHTNYLLLGLLGLACYAVIHHLAARVTVREACIACGFGAALSAALIVGASLRLEASLLPQMGAGRLLVQWVGLALLWGTALAGLMVLPPRGLPALEAPRAGTKSFFFIAWAGILLCWLPYFLFYYPGVGTYDTIDQYSQILSGVYSNPHPVTHTLLMAAVIKSALALGFTEVGAVAAFTCVQMLGLSAFYARMACFVGARTRARWLAPATAALFALFPMHAYYAITLWKDIPFSAMVVCWSMLIWRAVESEGAVFARPRFVAGWVAALLLVCFLRNNGVLLLLGTLPFLFVHFKRQRRVVAITGAAVLAFFALVQGPLFSLLGVAQTRLAEGLAMPLQQVAFMVTRDVPLTDAQGEAIDKVLPREEIAEVFHTDSVDAIKYHPQFDGEQLAQNLGLYGQLWLTLSVRNPAEALQAQAALAYRYWYPDIPVLCSFEFSVMPIGGIDVFLTRPLVPAFRWVQKLDPRKLSIEYPLALPIFSSGAYLWYALAALCCVWARRMRGYALVLLPLLVLWLSLMVGVPYAEPRYIYPLYLAMPLYACLALRAARGEGGQPDA